MSTVAIILAADAGEGFETPKYLSPIDGVPMVVQVVTDASSWAVDSVVVVLGSDAEDVVPVLGDQAITVVIDPEWSEGSSSPLRAALDLVTRDRAVTHCLIARADQPGVPDTVVAALMERAADSFADAVVPKYRYARGWPVVIGRGLVERLLGVEGQLDLHDVISMHASTIEECRFDQLTPSILDTLDAVSRHRR